MTCVAEGCARPACSKGRCTMHYQRFRKHGSDDLPSRPGTADRIWERIEVQPNGCWKWVGYCDPGTGYGRIGGSWAHRKSYEEFSGPIPHGMDLDHLCRLRACVNPEHLEPVTRRVNVLRGIAPSAVAARTNVCQRGHEFTESNTYLRRNGYRMCRACIRMRARKSWRVAA